MKKVLSLLLVVTMLFGMFAVAASAVINDSALVAIIVTPKEDKNYKNGDIITFEVALQIDETNCADGIGSGCFVFGYDSDVLEPIATLPGTGLAGVKTAGVVLEGYDFNAAGFLLDDSTMTYVKNATETLVAEDVANGWDSALSISLPSTYGIYNQYFSATKVFAFQMKVKDAAAAGDYKVGITATSLALSGVEEKTIVDDVFGGIYGPDQGELSLTPGLPVFDRQMATFKVGSAVEVTHVKQQSKWNGGNDKNTAENYLFGFVGQVSGLELTTKDVNGRAMVQEIKSITATATYAGGVATSEVITVWDVEGGYQFRAQFKGFAPTDASEVSVVFAITMSDGTTVYKSASETKAINAIYAASVTNGLPALAA